jgi:C1A family cysteine protease
MDAVSRTQKINGQDRHMFGWVPDSPDHRDMKMSVSISAKKALPEKVDLRQHCSRVEDQGQIGSCTANASTSAIEFLYKIANKPQPDLSRLYCYFSTRVWVAADRPTEDGGAMIRDVMKALAGFGVCLEPTWPYVLSKSAWAPHLQARLEAKEHQILKYYRLPNLEAMKVCLSQGFPFVGGFSVPVSIHSQETRSSGVVKYPTIKEGFLGGHAVLFVGYDNKTKRLLFKNSWGTGWGENGFGYLPYEFVTNWLANDFWTIRTAEL